MAIAALSGWTSQQKSAVLAAYLGWTLDAFDFFLLVFVLKDVAKEFNTGIPAVALAVTLTLAMRPIGAFVVGRAADLYGRRPVLVLDVLFYSVLAFASGFAPSLLVLIVLRALFGIAMGGEWGVGSSLAMETIPVEARGLVSGILQSGYPTGYLIASVAYGALYDQIGWRGLLMLGVIPGLIILYIRRNVPESPSWQPKKSEGSTATVTAYLRLIAYAAALAAAFEFYSQSPALAAVLAAGVLGASLWLALRNPALWIEFFAVLGMAAIDYATLIQAFFPLMVGIIYNAAAVMAGAFLKAHWRMGIYAVLLMAGFNFFSHGTQDLYPTFLQVQHGFSPHLTSILTIVGNVGAIVGSLVFGMLSERIGRRRGMVIAALLALPVIPLWVSGHDPVLLGAGAFLMQFAVQSAWGIVPVHLNELSPPEVRGTFPGFTYQLGNLLASANATIQAGIAVSHGNNYGLALGIVGGCAAIAIALLAGFGVERKGVHMGNAAPQGA